MIRNPRVGQVVRLNNYGIRMTGGFSSWEDAEQAKRCTITAVSDDLHLSDAPDVVTVEVDAPSLGCYLLTNQDFDLLENA